MVKAPKKAARAQQPEEDEGDRPGPLHNGPEDRAVSAVQLGKLARAKTRLESETGSYRNVVKHVEAKGLNIKAAKRALAIKSSIDRDELVVELKYTLEYLAILGFAIEKKQLDLFAHIDGRTPAIETAAHNGRMAALRGEGEGSIPYAVESKQGQAWLEAFRNGMDEYKQIIEMDAAVGDETLIKGEQDGEDDVVDTDTEDSEAGAAPNPDAYGEDVDPVHAEFDAADPGAELDPEKDAGAALH